MSTSGCSSREVTGGQRPFCAIWRGASTQSASSRATRSSQITGECGGTDNWQERPRRRLICLRRRKRARQRKDQRGAGIELRVKIIVELLRLHPPADRGVFANVCDFCRGLDQIYSRCSSPRILRCQNLKKSETSIGYGPSLSSSQHLKKRSGCPGEVQSM